CTAPCVVSSARPGVSSSEVHSPLCGVQLHSRSPWLRGAQPLVWCPVLDLVCPAQ
ncbi:hypothetical protein NDU88_005928, partial [Pleurodeles waltl]